LSVYIACFLRAQTVGHVIEKVKITGISIHENLA
jgi:hypothetical protein